MEKGVFNKQYSSVNCIWQIIVKHGKDFLKEWNEKLGNENAFQLHKMLDVSVDNTWIFLSLAELSF